MFVGLNDEEIQSSLALAGRHFVDEKSVERRWGSKAVRIIPCERAMDLLTDMYNRFVRHFNANLHPVPQISMQWTGPTSTGSCAHFDLATWTISFNPRIVSVNQDWTRRQAAIVFRSMYHEMRHAEQFCMIIRYVWSTHQGARDADLRQRSLTTLGGLAPPLHAVSALQNVPFEAGSQVSVADYELAGKLFQSFFRTTVLEERYTGVISGPFETLEYEETLAANTARASAEVYASEVDADLKLWNEQKPSTFMPAGAIEISIPDGAQLDGMRTMKPLTSSYYQTCYRYLQSRREIALDYLDHTYATYVGVPLEADAHQVEGKFAKQLKLGEEATRARLNQLGVLRDSEFLPEPMLW
jgi:hypothetical protein